MQEFLQRIGQYRKLGPPPRRGVWFLVGGIIALLSFGTINPSAAVALTLPVTVLLLIVAVLTSVVASVLRLFIR